MRWYTSSSGLIEFQLPTDCIEQCSASGSVDEAVDYWQKQLQLNLNKADMIKELNEYGCWETLEYDSRETLERRIIWLAAGDMADQE